MVEGSQLRIAPARPPEHLSVGRVNVRLMDHFRLRQVLFDRAVHGGIQPGDDGPTEVLQGSQTVFEFSQFDLGADDFRLCCGGRLVSGPGNPLEIPDQIAVLHDDRNRPGEIIVLVVGVLDLVEESELLGIVEFPGGTGRFGGDILAQRQLAQPGKRLCESDCLLLRADARLDLADEIAIGQPRVW